MNLKKIIAISLSIFLLVLSVSCKNALTEDDVLSSDYDFAAQYNQDFSYDIVKELPNSEIAMEYLEQKFPKGKFELVHEEISERESKFEAGYEHEIVWTFKDNSRDELSFNVFLDYNSIQDTELLRVNFTDNYNVILARTLIEDAEPSELSAEEKSEIKWFSETEDLTTAELCLSSDSSLDKISEKVALAEKINEFLRAKASEMEINFGFYVKHESIVSDFSIHYGPYNFNKFPVEKISSSINEADFIFKLQNRIGAENYTAEDKAKIRDLLSDTLNESYQFRLVDFVLPNTESIEHETDTSSSKNGQIQFMEKKTIFWDDLADYGNRYLSVSMPSLFEILKRLAWESLEGDQSNFSFTGADKHKYEFSYDFIDEKSSEKIFISDFDQREYLIQQKYLNADFFFKLDGQRVDYEPQESGLTAIHFGLLEDITGYYFRKSWEEPVVVETENK